MSSATGEREGAGAASDDAVVARALRDGEAFAELYRRYVDAVYWYCARRLADPWAAEDATAQVFVQVLAALPRFVAGEGTFRAWLFRIAHNVVVDAVRRRRRYVPLGDVEDVLVDAAPTPEEALLVGERERALRRAMDPLTDDQRSVVLLRLAGLTGVEIAEALGRSRPWVDTTHHRAIARLRKLLVDGVAVKEGRDATR